MKKKISIFQNWKSLNEQIVSCCLCPRLVNFRENVPCKKKYADEDYWRKPLPGFGDPNAEVLLLGLAPSPHGGNRTGRIFTGDETGRFLVKALHRAGLANQPICESLGDGLKLKGCFLSAVVKCVPPLHKPMKTEIVHCRRYWTNELKLLKQVHSVVAFGKVAFDDFLAYAREKGESTKGMRFAHGAHFEFETLPALYASYHPTPRNTQTGLLSEKMLISLLKKAKRSSL